MSHVAMLKCFICGDDAQILLNKTLKDISEYHNTTRPGVYCSKCQKAIDAGGIAVIEIDTAKTKVDDGSIYHQKAYRTGAIAFIKKEALETILDTKIDTPGVYVETGFLASIGVSEEQKW